MSESEETNHSAESTAGIDRRRVLKGAIATGVGVAVWSTPSISSMGGTPVYAANCSATVLRFGIGTRNTSCDCEIGRIKFVGFKELNGGPCEGDLTGGPSVVLQKTVNGMLVGIGNDGDCAKGTVKTGPKTPGSAVATIGPNGDDLFCQLEIRVTRGRCPTLESDVLAVVTSCVVDSEGGTVDIPKVQCTGNSLATASNIFLDVGLLCSTDFDCLDTTDPKCPAP